MRWIRQHPDRLFVNRRLDCKLQVNLDENEQIHFHHCILAMGARDACKAGLAALSYRASKHVCREIHLELESCLPGTTSCTLVLAFDSASCPPNQKPKPAAELTVATNTRIKVMESFRTMRPISKKFYEASILDQVELSTNTYIRKNGKWILFLDTDEQMAELW